MKLKQLVIHNIASIEDATIDFEKAPLSESEVFLIAGKTGAGKSTILDAICLALYDKTPRFVNSRMEGQDVDDDIRVSDTRLLIRENTAECFASLSFTGNNGVDYIAKWSLSRARKKVEGKLQSRVWTLENMSKGYTLSKVREVEAELLEAIGLDFNQFCRTTMLAQGEFARFLNSADNDKAAILEKITGMDIYSKIGARIYEKTKEKETEWLDSKRALEGVELLDEEKETEIKKRIEELDKSYETISDSVKKDKIKKDWLDAEELLQGELLKAEGQMNNAISQTKTESFQTKLTTVENWKKTAEVRMTLKKLLDDEQKLKTSRESLDNRQKDYRLFVEGCRYEQMEKTKIAGTIVKINEFIEGERDKVETYEREGEIGLSLRTLAEKRQAIERESAKTVGLEGKIAKSLEQIDKEINPRLTELEQKKRLLEENKKGKEQELEKTMLHDLRKRHEESNKRISLITIAQAQQEAISKDVLKLNALKQNRDNFLISIETIKRNHPALEEAVAKAQIRKEEAQRLYDSQKDSVDRFAKLMRSTLHVGDDCPVCRQKIQKVFESEEQLDLMVTRLKSEAEKAENELNEANKLLMRNEAELKESERTLVRLNSEIDRQEKELEEKHQLVMKSCREVGIECQPETDEDVLKEEKAREMERNGDIARKIKEAEILESQLRSIYREIEGNNAVLEQCRLDLQKINQEIATQKTDLEISKNLISRNSEENSALEKRLEQIVEGDWETDWHSAPEKFALELKSKSEKFKQTQRQKTSLEQSLEKSEEKYNSSQKFIGQFLELMPSWSAVEAEEAKKDDRLIETGTNLLIDVKSLLTQIGQSERSIEEGISSIEDFLSANPTFSRESLTELNRLALPVVQRLETEIKKTESDVVAAEANRKQIVERQVAHRTSKPTFEAENDSKAEIEERIEMADNHIRRIGEEKGALRQQLDINAQNLAKVAFLQQEIETKRTDYEPWRKLNDLIGDKNGATFKKIAQSYVLENLIKSANHYMNTLSGRYRLRTTPGSFVISVDDAYQGYANRAASTLSGGETFLVSLSLALALSDIGPRLGVDNLFIDEGFGTLSGEPLRRAIETLRTLHSKTGKHVGIISHVEELQEKIPVQIRVEQDGKSSSSRIRVIPD